MEMIGAFDPVQLVELVRPWAIVARVATMFHRSAHQIYSRDRSSRISQARMIAMYLIRRSMDLSFPQIGEIFNRDHSTVIHARNIIARRMEAVPQFREFVNAILQSRDR